MNNNRLIYDAMSILRWRAKNTRTGQARMAYTFAYNLLVYAMRGDKEKIKEFMEEIENGN